MTGVGTHARRWHQVGAAVSMGLRLAATSRTWSTLAVVACTAVGTASLLLALAMPGIITARSDRALERTGFQHAYDPDGGGPTPDQFPHVFRADRLDTWQGKMVVRSLIADPSGASEREPALIPPGLARIPAPGTAIVSPALADALTADPTGEIGAGLGQVIGQISPNGLLYPDELIAWVGVDIAQITRSIPGLVQSGDGYGDTAMLVNRFGPGSVGGRPAESQFPPGISQQVKTLLLAAAVSVTVPIVLLVVSTSTLMRAHRRRTLASLSTIGVRPRVLRATTAAEASVLAIAGWLLGWP